MSGSTRFEKAAGNPWNRRRCSSRRRPGRARRENAGRRDGGPIRVVEGVVVLDALRAAEGQLAHIELHDVVVDPEAAEDLQAGVPEDVIDRAEPGGQRVSQAEPDGIVGPPRVVPIVREGRHVLAFRPDAGVQGQPVHEGPGILEIDRQVIALDLPDASIGGRERAPDDVVAVSAVDVAGVGDRVGIGSDVEVEVVRRLAPVQVDPGMGRAGVPVFIDVVIADARLHRVLAPRVEVERGVHVVADLAAQVPQGLRVKRAVGPARGSG